MSFWIYFPVPSKLISNSSPLVKKFTEEAESQMNKLSWLVHIVKCIFLSKTQFFQFLLPFKRIWQPKAWLLCGPYNLKWISYHYFYVLVPNEVSVLPSAFRVWIPLVLQQLAHSFHRGCGTWYTHQSKQYAEVLKHTVSEKRLELNLNKQNLEYWLMAGRSWDKKPLPPGGWESPRISKQIKWDLDLDQMAEVHILHTKANLVSRSPLHASVPTRYKAWMVHWPSVLNFPAQGLGFSYTRHSLL